MNNKPYKEIAKISPEERETIRRKTAYSLPDDPSARGMRPDQVRKRFWEAIAGDKSSIFEEIDRLAAETNTALDALWMMLYGTVEIDGEAVGIADLIKTGLAQAYTLSDLFEGLASGDALRLIHEKTTGKNLQQCLDDLGKLDLTAKVAPISGGHRVTLTDKNGERYFDVMDGEKGDIGLTGPQGVQGPRGVQGVQGPQGQQGKPFSIAKVYQSINAMHAGYATDGVEIGGFVVIETGNVDDADNARLYLKGNYAYEYVTDLSGMQGMQGPQGPQGIQGVQGKQGPIGPVGPVGPVGMHIGPEAPTDGQVAWIDTDEEPSEDEGGGSQIDVVAKPGQVIVVATVDANGKPLTYKAVDLPVHDAPDWNAAEGEAGHVLNRTHYVDEKGVIHKLPNKFIDADWMATSEKHVDNTIVIPEQSVTSIWNKRQMDIQPGIIYDVHINGVVYPCEALNEDGGIILGNNTSLTMNNLPFCIFWAGGTATGGFFYKNSSVLTGTIYMKVTGHSYEKYNKLPKEFLPDVPWEMVTDKPFAEDTGELLFSHTSNFATDNANEKITGVSLPLTVGAGYWLEINGDMVKCHCESAGTATFALYDTAGNMWLKKSATILFVYGQTAGSYTYKLYEMKENIVLNPQCIPSSIARKSDIPEGGGSASIDVTAQVGQTIIVKEVDADGKPTKWESADYQPRTHWSEAVSAVLVDNQSFGEHDETFFEFMLVSGQSYHIVFNGVEYDEVARPFDMDGMAVVVLGNVGIYGFEDTGEPYLLLSMEGMGTIPVSAGGDYTLTLSTTQEVVHKLPDKYMPEFRPYTIIIGNNGDNSYMTFSLVADVETALASGREINGVIRVTGSDFFTPLFLVAYSATGNETEYGRVLVLRDLYILGLMFKLTPQEDGTYSVTKITT